MKSILIIDDKLAHADGTGTEFYNKLPLILQQYVKVDKSITNTITIVDENSVRINFEPTDYQFVFLHDSYNDKNLDEGQLASFKRQVNNLILFSGGKEPNLLNRSTSRSYLFSSLRRALEASIESGYFPIKSLFDMNYQVYYPILDKLEDMLLESKETFIKSSELKFFLKILHHAEYEIDNEILPHYLTLTPQILNQKIEDWRRKNI